MERFILFTVNGLTLGAIYASMALALVIIWRSTRVLNFAQGAQAAASAYIAWSVTDVTGSFWLGLAAALVGGAVLGVLVQQTVFRRAESMPPLNSAVVGVGLLILIEAALGMLFAVDETRTIGSAFSTKSYQAGSLPLVSPQDLFVVGAVTLTVVTLGLLLARTAVGLRMRAAAFAPQTARLMGVQVPLMLSLGWALAGVAGGLAAMLYTPTATELVPTVLDGLLVLGFTAAIVGGLDSLVGAVTGGLACGLALSYTSGYSQPDLLLPVAFLLLIGVLLVRPQGLFSSSRTRKV